MKLFALGLLLTSSAIHAGCGDLHIKIINNSNNNCTFKNKVTFYGTLPNASIPTTVAAGQSSSTMIATQDDVGINVLITYMCDREVVKFYSLQQFCGFPAAGYVMGEPHYETTTSLDYQTQDGAYFAGRPGTITWTIS